MIHPTAIISPDAIIGKDCEIGAYAYIGENVKLGDNVKIMAHAYLEHCEIGSGTSISQSFPIIASGEIIAVGCIIFYLLFT